LTTNQHSSQSSDEKIHYNPATTQPYLNIVKTPIEKTWEIKTTKKNLSLRCLISNLETQVIWKNKATYLLKSQNFTIKKLNDSEVDEIPNNELKR
jgi:hypothetical protein